MCVSVLRDHPFSELQVMPTAFMHNGLRNKKVDGLPWKAKLMTSFDCFLKLACNYLRVAT